MSPRLIKCRPYRKLSWISKNLSILQKFWNFSQKPKCLKNILHCPKKYLLSWEISPVSKTVLTLLFKIVPTLFPYFFFLPQFLNFPLPLSTSLDSSSTFLPLVLPNKHFLNFAITSWMFLYHRKCLHFQNMSSNSEHLTTNLKIFVLLETSTKI